DDRAADAGQQIGGPAGRFDERLPLGRCQLPVGVECAVDDPAGDDEEHGHDHRQDLVERLGAGSRCVVENGSECTHRATSYRLLSRPKNRPVGRVRMTNPSAKMPPTTKMAASFSIIVFISSEASDTPMTEAIVEFLVNAMSTEPSGAMTARNACGRTIRRRFWLKVRPSERPASDCPSETVLMPERSDSHTNA